MKYVLPSMLSMIGSSCYVLVDTLFVAQISSTALAALNLIMPIYSLETTFGIFLAVGASTHYSFLRAKGQTEEGSRYFTHALVLGVAVSVITAVLTLAFKTEIATVLGANEATLGMCIDYMDAYVSLSPFICLQMIILSFIRNDGDPKLASMAALGGSIFNLCFDYFFIFTLRMGMFGAALATGLSPVIGLLITIPYFKKKRNQFRIVKCRFSKKILSDISNLGMPSLIQGASSGIVMLAFNRQLLAIGGNIAVTAYGIIFNVAVVLQYCMSGISEGVQPLISQSYSIGDKSGIKEFRKMAILSIAAVASVGLAAAVFAADPIITVFNSGKDPVLQQITKSGMRIFFLGLYAYGINHFLGTYFTSVNQSRPANTIAILKTGIVITPLVLILPSFLGLNGVWMSYPLSELLIMIVGLKYLMNDCRRESLISPSES